MFACLLSKTKLIFLPRGGKFLFNGPEAFPFSPPIHPLPACVLLPQMLRGTFPRGFFLLSKLFSAVSTALLCQLGSCDSPSQSSSCELCFHPEQCPSRALEAAQGVLLSPELIPGLSLQHSPATWEWEPSCLLQAGQLSFRISTHSFCHIPRVPRAFVQGCFSPGQALHWDWGVWKWENTQPNPWVLHPLPFLGWDPQQSQPQLCRRKRLWESRAGISSSTPHHSDSRLRDAERLQHLPLPPLCASQTFQNSPIALDTPAGMGNERGTRGEQGMGSEESPTGCCF